MGRTKNDNNDTVTAQWECVQRHRDTGYQTLHRLPVPGGWLYCAAPGDYRAQMVFVPEPLRALSQSELMEAQGATEVK